MAKIEETSVKKVTVKFKRLQEIDNIYGWLLRTVDGFSNTKFGYSLKRFVDKNKQFFTDYNDALYEVRIDNAKVNKDTETIILDQNNPRGFAYGKEEFKKLIKEEKAILDKFQAIDCEVEPYVYKGETSNFNLGEDEVEILKGLVI